MDPIGTINVRLGNQRVPRVQTISYGQNTALKNASDLSMVGAQNGYVISYNQFTNSFEVTAVSTSAIPLIDGGSF